MRFGRDGIRLFAIYALASLLPVLALGAALAAFIQHAGDRRALDDATRQARTVAQVGIQPALGDRGATAPISASARSRLRAATATLIDAGTVARLRLRATDGTIVFDASAPDSAPRADADVDALEAAKGETVRELTKLNSDEVDRAGGDARAVEVYLPLRARGVDDRVSGVLETYVPYSPIAAVIERARVRLLRTLFVGMLLLWLALGAITWSITTRLRRVASDNEHLALHDTLTGLANRTLFSDRAQHALGVAARKPHDVTIAILDIDDFKRVNETLGHHNGDALLRHVAERILAAVRPGDTVARLDGDEFGLVLSEVGPERTETVLARVLATAAEEIELDGVPVSAEAVVGSASWPRDADDVAGLLQAADVAMYAAKTAHTRVVAYSPDLAHFDEQRLALVGQLRRAIAGNELVLHYQPKVDAASGALTSVEALVRWNHPTRGLLAPAAFLHVAESTGLIGPLTTWVLEAAVRQLVDWRHVGHELTVAVNLSARDLREELPASIGALLRKHAIASERLSVEVTETAVVDDPLRAGAILNALASAGVCVALDDFGQGYTSLAHLRNLPIHELKIDKTFIDGITQDGGDRAIVRSVIELGHQLGMQVIGEGVETEAQAAALAAMGCDALQGFLIARPMDAGALLDWIAGSPRGAPSR